jgi:hypothetical protein
MNRFDPDGLTICVTFLLATLMVCIIAITEKC